MFRRDLFPGWLAALLLALPAFSTAELFTNPLLPTGPDPSLLWHEGHYFYIRSNARVIEIIKAETLAGLSKAEPKRVWQPPSSGPYSRNVWAPELNFLRGRWYIYVAADSGGNNSHRLWVLENPAADPQEGTWTVKGKLASPDDHWAIDGSVFEHHGRLYVVWSGWESEKNGQQNIYLAPMENPWTISGPRVCLSTPTEPWEKIGDTDPKKMPGNPRHIDVNEGPTILAHGGKLFLLYSASGCWTDDYTLGMLTAQDGDDLLKAASWRKSPKPVLSTSPEAHAYSTGHCGLFKSPDGREDWIVYHANPEPGQGCGSHRTPRAQKISWKADGLPDFGTPVPLGTQMEGPSGEAPQTRADRAP